VVSHHADRDFIHNTFDLRLAIDRLSRIGR
jgi:hypothetical protein